MAAEPRVILIKLADRLHNMRTLAGMSREHQERTARETMEVYAPLAHRLGMSDLRQMMEDLCFAALQPELYAEIDHLVVSQAPERDFYLAQVVEEVKSTLAKAHITAEVRGRPKHLWSIYEKMYIRGRPFEEIYDLVGVRVVVDNTKDCYAALGTIHSLWTPVQGRFKDYIAQPKFNTYQSIHTTVIGPKGKMVELQIRTRDMHRAAEIGVAAHYSYKDREKRNDREVAQWLQGIVDWQTYAAEPAEFIDSLRAELRHDEVIVFTPKGAKIALPVGATPVDFAYAIHTEVGHRCIGAKVNSQLVPLDAALNPGDTVEIVTSKVGVGAPREEWLGFVRSKSAQYKIRTYLSKERREDEAAAGFDELERALRREQLESDRLLDSDLIAATASSLGFKSPGDLFLAIGDGRIAAEMVVKRVRAALFRRSSPAEGRAEESIAESAFATPGPGPEGLGTPAAGSVETSPGMTVADASAAQAAASVGRVHVEGFPGEPVAMASCCRPVAGTAIVGYRDPVLGTLIHLQSCPSGAHLAASGLAVVGVDWITEPSAERRIRLRVKGLDRPRLLSDITGVVAAHGLNIVSCSAETGSNQIFVGEFRVTAPDSQHVDEVLERIRDVDNVFDAGTLGGSFSEG
jgi:GTP pyrophosphokinase